MIQKHSFKPLRAPPRREPELRAYHARTAKPTSSLNVSIAAPDNVKKAADRRTLRACQRSRKDHSISHGASIPACHAPEFRIRTHRIHTPELPRRSVGQKLSSRACRRVLSITGKRRNRLASDTVIDAATFSDVSVLRAMRLSFGFARVSLTCLSSGFTCFTLKHRCLSAKLRSKA